ncbi:EAL domain-containing protein [Cupriavidus necator]|uniref:EAL domain-containing protein n=1 Tax=Cupriavidus necator TaxID=106590 RepID=UPI002352D15B|nr:EAL domain-containing protein [Cupriavidus necator]
MLEEEDLPAQHLELELTEGVAMRDPQRAIAMIQELHERGVCMSIDDFGTGYSSLAQLKKFQVRKLKIDQSFVRDIATNAEDRAIVGAIVQMARNLGLLTIAEGVETAEQISILRAEGCNEMQGYYFSKPLSAVQFEQFARTRESCPDRLDA